MSPTGDPSSTAASVYVMDTVVGRPETTSCHEEVVLLLRDMGLMPALEDVHQQLEHLLEAGPSSLTVDLTGVEVNSTAVAALLWVRRRCGSRGVTLGILGYSRRSVGVLRRIGFVDAGDRAKVMPASPGPGHSSFWGHA